MAVVDEAGAIQERVRWDAFGQARHRRWNDVNGDGDYDSADRQSILSLAMVASSVIGNAGYNVDCDLDLDGDVDLTDLSLATTNYQPALPGGSVSLSEIGNPYGYTGALHSPESDLSLFRNRWYSAVLGRWVERDPAGYVDGLNLYLYVGGNPILLIDPMGLMIDGRRIVDAGEDDAPWYRYFGFVAGGVIDSFGNTVCEAKNFVEQEAVELAAAGGNPATYLANQVTDAAIDSIESREALGQPTDWLNVTLDVGAHFTGTETFAEGAVEVFTATGRQASQSPFGPIWGGLTKMSLGASQMASTAAGTAGPAKFGLDMAISNPRSTNQILGKAVESAPGPVSPRVRTGIDGRVESSIARIDRENLGQGTRTTDQTRAFAQGLGNPGDDAGHIIGRRLGGRGDDPRNVMPLNPNLNRGALSQFERTAAGLFGYNGGGFMRVRPHYLPGATRPHMVSYGIRIAGLSLYRTFRNP